MSNFSEEDHKEIHSLKLTAKAPTNGWLEYKPFLLGRPIFRGKLLVSGRVLLVLISSATSAYQPKESVFSSQQKCRF